LKSDDIRDPTDVGTDSVPAKSFIGTRAAGLYYSSDDSDEEGPIRRRKRKNPYGPRTTSSSKSLNNSNKVKVDKVARALFDDEEDGNDYGNDDEAQPKESRSRRRQELKMFKRSAERVKERKHSSGIRQKDLLATAHDQVHHVDCGLAHPPASARSRPASCRSLKVQKSKSFSRAESKTVQLESSVAEAKSPKPHLRAEYKRTYPVKLLRYDEDKAQSKDVFGVVPGAADVHVQAKGIDSKSSV
jgi:hypothetical protein